LPKNYKVIDAYSNEDYGVTNYLEIDMEFGETRSFIYEKEND
jgi:hypothetical protein